MPHEHGRVRSGDVDIFYRRFGTPGAVPMLLFHGGNYYDSHDWVEVAEKLSHDREVAAFDARGFGESGRSSTRDYSHAAQMADALGVLDHLGWARAIVVGHSRGGAYALLFAARFPQRGAGLVIIDYCPGYGIGPRGMPVVMSQSIGNQFQVFPDANAALAGTSRFAGGPGAAHQRRFASLLRTINGGLVLAKRDPDFSNQIPTAPGPWPALDVGDMWVELDKVRAPTLVVRALRSTAGYTNKDVERLRSDHPEIDVVDIESGHDVIAESPDELARTIQNWSTRHDNDLGRDVYREEA